MLVQILFRLRADMPKFALLKRGLDQSILNEIKFLASYRVARPNGIAISPSYSSKE